jgi:hypothetical protein
MDRLSNIFQQMGKRGEQVDDVPDNLKNAVFSTLDAATLLADLVDLFTVKLIQSQAEVIDSLPGSDYGNEEKKLYEYYLKKFEEKG